MARAKSVSEVSQVSTVGKLCTFLFAFLVPFLGSTMCLNADTIKVSAGKTDIDVVPDLYNTGPQVKEESMVKPEGTAIKCKLNGKDATLNAVFSGQEGNYSYALNFAYTNNDVNGEYVFENTDFSDHDFKLLGADAIATSGRSVVLHFINCKFKSFAGTRYSANNLSMTFEYCSFISVQGSDSTFDHCLFGGGVSDRMNLFVNCYVNNSYIYNPTRESDKDGVHIDGIQIYGDASSVTGNIHYNNCRFEMPSIKYPGAPNASVNACIMLQTEYSDGDDISFENCYVNGGGYTMYVHGCKGTKLSNIVLRNIHFGCAAQYGRLYPDRPEHDDVEWNEDTWDDASTLYVGTVTKDVEAGKTTLCVTNDTNQNRYFKIYTSTGNVYLRSIKACPLYKEFSERKLSFAQLPFDQKYEIPECCDWLVVCDVTNIPGQTTTKETVIRFQNWTEKETVQFESTMTPSLSYSVSGTTLKIDVLGEMPEFEPGKYPWSGCADSVEKVVVTGADSIAPYAFKDFKKLARVELNDSVRSIGKFAFAGCDRLSVVNMDKLSDLCLIGESAFENCVSFAEIHLPQYIREVQNNAFNVDCVVWPQYNIERKVYFGGTVKQWLHVSLGNAASNPMSVKGGMLYAQNKLVTAVDLGELGESSVGANVFCGCRSLEKLVPGAVKRIGVNAFQGTAISGTLEIPATVDSLGGGAFAHCALITKIIYNSSANIPNNAFVGDTNLEKITISGSVAQLKNNCLADCTKLSSVSLPDSVTLIGRAALQNCSALGSITIPKGVTEIADYAFSGCTGLGKIVFAGEQCPTISKHSLASVDSENFVVVYPATSDSYAGNSILQSICTKFETFSGTVPMPTPTPTPTPVPTPTPGAGAVPGDGGNPAGTGATPMKSSSKPTITQTSIKRLENKKGYSLYITWKKLSKSKATGYEIQYSTSSSFKKNVKTKWITSYSKSSVKITKLSKKKKYYVRIRTYKKISGKKYYSKWSTVKSIKIKK